MAHFIGFILLLLVYVIIRSLGITTGFIQKFIEKKLLYKAVKKSPEFQKYVVENDNVQKAFLWLPHDNSLHIWFIVNPQKISCYNNGYIDFKIDESISSKEVETRLKKAIDQSPDFQKELKGNKKLNKYLQRHPDGGTKVFVVQDKIWALNKEEYIPYQIGENFEKADMANKLASAISKTPTFQKYLEFDTELKDFLKLNPDGGIIDHSRNRIAMSQDQLICVYLQDSCIYVYKFGNEYKFIIGR